MPKKFSINVKMPKITKKEVRSTFKKLFEKKWKEFIAKEHLKYHVVKIRYVRKKDRLVLLTVAETREYIHLYFDDVGQIEKLLKAFRKDDFAKINEV